MMMITVKAYKSGTHCWPEAPQAVEFLRNEHRHVFHVEAEIQVFHDDRDLEFFLVQRYLNKALDEIFAVNNKRISCEEIANELRIKLEARYPGGRKINVRVSEDGENGVWLVDD